VKVKFIRIGRPLYCDAGPHEGDMRIDLTIKHLAGRHQPA
jgi:hypothetical protein